MACVDRRYGHVKPQPQRWRTVQKRRCSPCDAGSSAAIWMGTLLTLIPACHRVKATSYRAEVDHYDADLEANRATNGRLVVSQK
jgi:hypothetical protein